jgi:hypothetical protein
VVLAQAATAVGQDPQHRELLVVDHRPQARARHESGPLPAKIVTRATQGNHDLCLGSAGDFNSDGFE